MRKLSFTRKCWIKAGLFLLLFGLSLILFQIISVQWLFGIEKPPSGYFYTFVLLFGFLFYPFTTYISEKIDNKFTEPQIKNFKNGKRGDEGEIMVNRWLKEIPEAGEIFMNVNIPDTKYDIDCVLLNSKGLILIEVKNPTDKVFFGDDDGFFQIKNNQKIPLPHKDDPRRKLAHYASDLRIFLFAHEIEDIKQYKILVYPNNNVDWETTPGTYIVKTKDALKKYIARLPDDPELNAEKRAKIKMLLKPLSI